MNRFLAAVETRRLLEREESMSQSRGASLPSPQGRPPSPPEMRRPPERRAALSTKERLWLWEERVLRCEVLLRAGKTWSEVMEKEGISQKSAVRIARALKARQS